MTDDSAADDERQELADLARTTLAALHRLREGRDAARAAYEVMTSLAALGDLDTSRISCTGSPDSTGAVLDRRQLVRGTPEE